MEFNVVADEVRLVQFGGVAHAEAGAPRLSGQRVLEPVPEAVVLLLRREDVHVHHRQSDLSLKTKGFKQRRLAERLMVLVILYVYCLRCKILKYISDNCALTLVPSGSRNPILRSVSVAKACCVANLGSERLEAAHAGLVGWVLGGVVGRGDVARLARDALSAQHVPAHVDHVLRRLVLCEN